LTLDQPPDWYIQAGVRRGLSAHGISVTHTGRSASHGLQTGRRNTVEDSSFDTLSARVYCRVLGCSVNVLANYRRRKLNVYLCIRRRSHPTSSLNHQAMTNLQGQTKRCPVPSTVSSIIKAKGGAGRRIYRNKRACFVVSCGLAE
jgi:hypothetical protein